MLRLYATLLRYRFSAMMAEKAHGRDPHILKKYIKNNVLTIYFGVLVAAVLSACAMPVRSDNPMLERDRNAAAADVYFIRPRPERTMGMADNPVRIELDKQPFIRLEKGEYIDARLVPGEVYITLNSKTAYGPSRIKNMTHTDSFSFAAGKTYYVAIVPVDGEFRGVYFTAKVVDRDTALAMSRRAHPRSLFFTKKIN